MTPSSPTPSAEAPPWFLRKEGGEVYGPVPLSQMIAWAQVGRISPEDEVSQDRSTWALAPSCEKLDMCWRIEGPDGEHYGPVHLEACRGLVRDGQIEPGAVLHHARTGEKKTLDAAPAPSVRPDAVPSDAPPAWSIMALERDHSVDEARRWKALYEAERKSAMQAESASSRRIRELEQEVIRLQTQHERAVIEVQKLEQLAEHQEQATGSSQPGLAKVHYELSRRFDDLSQAYEEKLASVSGLREETERLRRENTERETRHRELLLGERAAADDARRKHAELEPRYADAVRSLREINDRFIRLRSGTDATGTNARMSNANPPPPASRSSAIPPSPAPTPTPNAGEKKAAPNPAGPRIRLTR